MNRDLDLEQSFGKIKVGLAACLPLPPLPTPGKHIQIYKMAQAQCQKARINISGLFWESILANCLTWSSSHHIGSAIKDYFIMGATTHSCIGLGELVMEHN